MLPCIGLFRWECVTCPKGIFFCHFNNSDILVYLHVVLSLTLWEHWKGGISHHTCFTSDCCPFLSQYTVSIFSLPEFSMILLAEPGPLPQLRGNCCWSRRHLESARVPGRVRYWLYLYHLNVHNNTMKVGVLTGLRMQLETWAVLPRTFCLPPKLLQPSAPHFCFLG